MSHPPLVLFLNGKLTLSLAWYTHARPCLLESNAVQTLHHLATAALSIIRAKQEEPPPADHQKQDKTPTLQVPHRTSTDLMTNPFALRAIFFCSHYKNRLVIIKTRHTS